MSAPQASHSTAQAKYLQEDDITEEYKALISSLPKGHGWVFSHSYQYQGFWLSSRMLQATLTCQRHFQARDTDLVLTTPLKCGTTWLKALTYTLLNRKNHAPTCKDHPLLKCNPHELISYLEHNLYVDHQVPDLSGLPSPRAFATHLPFGLLPKSIKETGCKLVFLCRDPKDAFISLWHYANKLMPKDKEDLPLEEAFGLFCEGVSLYGPFWDHVLDYWKYSLDKPDKILFLKFEDLKEQPELHLKRLAEFCGCPFSLEEEKNGVVEQILKLCSFENLSTLEVNKVGTLSTGEVTKAFFRKGEARDCANYLTPEMIDQIDKITQEKFHSWGLRF